MSKPRLAPEIHELCGSAADGKRDRALNLSASMDGGRPTRPSHLGKVAKKEWTRCCRLLMQRGTVTKADAACLELYCVLYQRHRLCLDEIDKNGMFEADADGIRVESAASKLATKLSIQLRALLVQLGLTPSAREKAKRVAPPKSKELIPGSMAWLEKQEAERAKNPPPDPEPEPEPADLVADVDEDALLD